MQLRPYQLSAVKAVEGEFAQGVRSTLLVMATGTGKTVTFAEIARKYRERTSKPVLVLAHRTELLEQAGGTLEGVGFNVGLEKAEARAGRFHTAVVASVQTLSRESRLKTWDPDHFGLIVIDEAHHSVGASYRAILSHFKSARILGVTATPNRHDQIGLRNVFHSVAFQYSIQDGIRDGYLCPIKGTQIEVEGIHLDEVRVVAGEFSQPQLDEMLRDEATLQSMVLPTVAAVGDRPTIIFTPGVEHAHEIAACFNRVRPGSARAVDGGMRDEDRANVLDDFKRGRFQFLSNVGICTEGFDHPPVGAVALFRPTRSLGLFAQMIGRGTRIAAGKEDCLVLDFVGVNNSVRTMTVMDVLDGSVLSDTEHKKAQELQKEGADALEALEKAKKFVAGLDSVRAKMKAFSTASAFDVLKMFEIPSVKGMYGGDLATERQVAYLERVGIKCPAELEKAEASQLIDRMVKRTQNGYATWKQMKYLRKLGVKEGLEDLSFEEASSMINKLVKQRGTYTKAA